MRTLLRTLLLLSVSCAFSFSSALACARDTFSFSELFAADTILRATATKYVTEANPQNRSTGVPESTVEFKVEEILKGVNVPQKFVLNGYLSNWDDFNETPVPYRVVRRGGRAESGFANHYKQGAQYLLFLKKTERGYTS